jgi:nucleoside-diphosphate-sugar epimerase
LRRATSNLALLDGLDLHRVEWVDCDVTDIVGLEEAMRGVTHVIHCAAMVSFHPRDYDRMQRVNVEGTANVVNLALDEGVKKCIHVSSIAAFGRSPERHHLTEASPWVSSKANTRYAISKYQSEQEVWRAHAEGLPVAVVNPSMVIGSGYWDVNGSKFFKQVYDGLKFWPVGRSGFVDVRDVAQFIVLLLESDVVGERYILNAENLEYRDFFTAIAAALGKKPPFIKVTPLLAEVAWRVEKLKTAILGGEPMVTKESARASVGRYTYGNEKSKNFPGFAYRPIETTIRETAQQLLEAAPLGFPPRML